jgi:hypothetical protein
MSKSPSKWIHIIYNIIYCNQVTQSYNCYISFHHYIYITFYKPLYYHFIISAERGEREAKKLKKGFLTFIYEATKIIV